MDSDPLIATPLRGGTMSRKWERESGKRRSTERWMMFVDGPRELLFFKAPFFNSFPLMNIRKVYENDLR